MRCTIRKASSFDALPAAKSYDSRTGFLLAHPPTSPFPSVAPVDETPIRYLAPGHGKARLGCLWTCGVPRGAVIFHWETRRAATCLDHIIPADFRGTIQCDGCDGFARRRGSQIVPAGCLAHVRRKFFGAKETAPEAACWFLQPFQNLYRLEEELREAWAGPQRRAVARASLS